MLAGKFAAWAGTFECNVGEINLCLVRFAATALAFPPDGQLIGAFTDPFSHVRQSKPCLFRSFIGCEGQYLIFGQGHWKSLPAKLLDKWLGGKVNKKKLEAKS